jgi:hypothetical protein
MWPENGQLVLRKVPGLLKMFPTNILIKQRHSINELLIYFRNVAYLLHVTDNF